jgi:hypothetical protein
LHLSCAASLGDEAFCGKHYSHYRHSSEKLRGNNDFIGKIQLLIPYMKNLASKCTFISSTSVYGDCNDNVTEETDLKPESEGGRR